MDNSAAAASRRAESGDMLWLQAEGDDALRLVYPMAGHRHQRRQRIFVLFSGLFMALALVVAVARQGHQNGWTRDALAMSNLWGTSYYPSYYYIATPPVSYPQYQYQQLAAGAPAASQSLVGHITAPYYKPAQNIKDWGSQRVKFEVARLMKEEDLSVKAEQKMATAVSTLAHEVEEMKVEDAVEKVDGDEGHLSTKLVMGPPGPPGPPGAPGARGAPGTTGQPGMPGSVEYVPQPAVLAGYIPSAAQPLSSQKLAAVSAPIAISPPLATTFPPAFGAEQAPKIKKQRAAPEPKSAANSLSGRLFAVRVPDGVKAGDKFDAQVPGHGLEAVTVPKGVHSGQVLDIETSDVAKPSASKQTLVHSKAAHSSASSVSPVSMPPPNVPPPKATAAPRAAAPRVVAPPPLSHVQREQLREALGHETYQMVVNEALKVDRDAAHHKAAARARSALLGDAHVGGSSPIVESSHASLSAVSPKMDAEPISKAAPISKSSAVLQSRARMAAAAPAHAEGVKQRSLNQLPPALRKAALSVHKMATQQKALESSVDALEKVATSFLSKHAAHQVQPLELQTARKPAKEMELADLQGIDQMRQQQHPLVAAATARPRWSRGASSASRAAELMDRREGSEPREDGVAGAGARRRRLLVQKGRNPAAEVAVSKGNSAAELAQRVTDMGATWNEILHPNPVLQEHPTWALPQLNLQSQLPQDLKIEAPRAKLQWKPYVHPGGAL